MQYNSFVEGVIRRIAEIAPHYSEWKFDRDNPDAGSALALIFAQQLGGSVERFYKMPFKHKIALYKLLGADLLLAEGSTGFLQVICPRNSRGQNIKKGFKFYSPPTEKGRLIFETQEDIFVTPAELTDVIYTDYDNDIIQFWEGELPFVVTNAKNEHLFEFRHEYISSKGHVYFNINGSKDIKEKLCDKKKAEAYYKNEQGQKIFTECEASKKGICFIGLHDSLDTPFSVGFKILDIKEFEDAAISDITAMSEGAELLPDAIIVKGEEQSIEEFYAFGKSYTVYDDVAIFCDEALSVKNSHIKLSFEVDFDILNEGEAAPYVLPRKLIVQKKNIPKPRLYDVKPESVVWEYYNGLGFAQLPLKTSANGLFSRGQGGRFELEFLRPDDMMPVLIGSKEGYCIRIRLSEVKNAWKLPANIYIPRLKNVRFSYKIPSTSIKSCTQYTNGQCLELEHISNLQFSRPLSKKPALYLGFDKPLSGGVIRLFVQGCGGEKGVWEYFSREGWKDLNVDDDTQSLARSGIISLNVGSDICETKVYGRSKYWLRIVFEKQGALALEHIYLNSVAVRQCETTLNETYFVDKSGIVKLNHSNILDETVFVGENFEDKLIALKDYKMDRAEGIIEFSDELKRNDGFAFRIDCRFGGGRHTDMPKDTEFIPATSTEAISKAKNPLPLLGGCERESLIEAAERIGKNLRNSGRSVTAQDYCDLINSNEIAGMEVFSKAGRITLVVLIKDYSNDYAFLNFCRRAKTIINECRPVGMAEIEICPPSFVPLDIKAEILVKNGGGLQEIKNTLFDICDPIARMKSLGMGSMPSADEIRNALSALPIVKSCRCVLILNESCDKPYMLPVAGKFEIKLFT